MAFHAVQLLQQYSHSLHRTGREAHFSLCMRRERRWNQLQPKRGAKESMLLERHCCLQGMHVAACTWTSSASWHSLYSKTPWGPVSQDKMPLLRVPAPSDSQLSIRALSSRQMSLAGVATEAPVKHESLTAACLSESHRTSLPNLNRGHLSRSVRSDRRQCGGHSSRRLQGELGRGLHWKPHYPGLSQQWRAGLLLGKAFKQAQLSEGGTCEGLWSKPLPNAGPGGC